MALSGTMTNPEIGKALGRGAASVQLKLKYLGFGNPAYRIQKTKHKHLRRPVFEYFLTHSWKETKERFRLTDSELKSIFTVGYMDPSLAHLRKDTRNREPWGLKDWLFMARRLGLRPRKHIGVKLGRGKDRVIKERLKSINAASKYLNGMPRKWAAELWGDENLPSGIKTDAGPSGQRGNFHFVIIPWPEALELAQSFKTPEHVRQGIEAMSKFQLWIHGTKHKKSLREKLRRIMHEQ